MDFFLIAPHRTKMNGTSIKMFFHAQNPYICINSSLKRLTSSAVAAVCSCPLNPQNKNTTPEITAAGSVSYIIAPMWSNSPVPTQAGAMLVVSDSGDILSPKIEPATIAPTTIGRFASIASAIPYMATPAVPAEVQELPVRVDMIKHSKKAVR